MRLIIAVFTCLVCTSCMLAKDKVKGNGNVVKEIRETESFNQLEIGGVFQIYLSQGEKEIVDIEADDNLHQYIKTDVKNGVLSINIKSGINIGKSTKLNIYITIKDLNRLKHSGVGRISCLSHLKLNQLDVSNSGVGSLELKGKASEVSLKNSGVGSIKMTDFEVEYLNVRNSGVGSVKVNAAKELSVRSSGVGNVYYTGNAVLKDINISGVGKFRKL